MNDKVFKILDENRNEIAKCIGLDMAIIFVKGYVNEFYNERIILAIEEEVCNYERD